MRKIHHSIAGIVLGLVLSVVSAHAAQHAVNIPAQPLQQALNEFARQMGLQLIVKDEDVDKALRSPELKGEFTVEEGLDRLLANSGLGYGFLNDRTVAVRMKTSEAGARPTAAVTGEDRLRMAESGAAQEGAQSSADSANSSSGSEHASQGKLEEVVVTAQKRQERLRDVPLSLSVVTADDIERRGLVSSEDYLRGIPGVTQASMGLYNQSIVIRGLEATRAGQNYFAGTTVANYFGETPTTTSAGIFGGSNIDLKLVDIDRVEVLRGPQGTAFGSSALGGVVRTIPMGPKINQFEGGISGGYSQTTGTGGDNSEIKGVLNIPLVQDKLAVRMVGYRFENAGYYRNVAGTDPAFQTAIVIPQGAQAVAVNQDHVGTSRFTGGRFSALYQATDAMQIKVSYLKQKTESDGVLQQNIGGKYEQTVLQVAPQGYLRSGQTGAISDSDIEIVNGTLDYKLNWADLTATYSYVDSGTLGVWPLTFAPGSGAYSWEEKNTQHSTSGELRLTTRLSGAWNFLGGLYTEENNDSVPFADYYWDGNAQGLFDTFGLTDPVLGLSQYTQKLKQKAAFAEASWTFLPHLTLTGGMRAYDYNRTGQRQTSGFFLGDVTRDLGTKASGSSFRGNLSYKPNDNALVYGGWAQGFRLGTIQDGPLRGSCGDTNNDGIIDGTSISIDSTLHTDSDTVNSYELGSKLAMLDGRLSIDADVYRVDWSKIPIQVYIPTPDPSCNVQITSNVGSARSQGVEFQTKFYVTRALRLDLGGSYVRARLTADAPALGAHAGERLPTPEVNANLSLQYEFNFRGSPAFVRLDQTYVGDSYATVQELAVSRTDPYVQMDASARMMFKRVSVDLFVTNLLNDDAFTFRGLGSGDGVPFFGYRLRPRTIGLQLGFNF